MLHLEHIIFSGEVKISFFKKIVMGLKIWTKSFEYPNENFKMKIATKLILFSYYVVRFSAN
jgi:hypothetical protein